MKTISNNTNFISVTKSSIERENKMKTQEQSSLIVAGILWLLLSAFLNAQTFLMEPVPETHLKAGVLYLRPDYAADVNQTIRMSTLSGSYDFYARIPMLKGLNAVVSMPVIVKASDGESIASGIGNFYFGLRTRADSIANNYSVFSVGLYLPTATSKRPVEFIGVFANFYKPQKALSDVLTLNGNFLYFKKQHRGIYLGFEIGPQVFIPVKSGGGSTNLLGHYGISTGYRFRNLAIGGEILGLANLTDSFNSFGERFDHSVAIGAQLVEYPIRPALFYQVVISDQNTELAQDILKGVVAMRLEINWR
jgi:hypothetical protein